MPRLLGKRARLSDDGAISTFASLARPTRSSCRNGEEKQQSSPFVIVSDHEDDENPFISDKPVRFSKRQRTSKTTSKVVEFHVEDAIENTPPQSTKGSIAEKSRHVDDLPTTPRHRDRANNKIAITPRHRVGLLNRPITPQSLRTPTTPRNFQSVYNEARKIFRTSVQSGKIIGRENERSELTGFIETRLETKSSGCIYVSGPPGTGKSALVTQICGELLEQYAGNVQYSYCNCMSVRSATDIYAKLFDDFGVADVMRGTEMDELRDTLHSKDKAHLVILDEIDHLLDIDLDLLYQLFSWALDSSAPVSKKKPSSGSSLVLVGIANALDLTDRFLPRLKAKNLKPHLLPFMPYSPTEISSVVTSKLKALLPEHTPDANYVPFIHPTAILFLSKKVAAQSGDIRKAFAICLKALDVIESETFASLTKSAHDLEGSTTPGSSVNNTPTKQPLGENVYLSSPSAVRTAVSGKFQSPTKIQPTAGPMAHLKLETAPRATIAHVARVTAAAFGQGIVQRLSGLSVQSKAALIALAVLTSRASTMPLFPDSQTDTPRRKIQASEKAPTVKELYIEYTKICTTENALPAAVTRTEFADVLESLETMSLISFTIAGVSGLNTPSKRGRSNKFQGTKVEDKRVVSCVGVKELTAALKEGPGSGVVKAMMCEGDL